MSMDSGSLELPFCKVRSSLDKYGKNRRTFRWIIILACPLRSVHTMRLVVRNSFQIH